VDLAVLVDLEHPLAQLDQPVQSDLPDLQDQTVLVHLYVRVFQGCLVPRLYRQTQMIHSIR
jgi:hypothetical protein